jgi:O-antigen/teichoic acid export membrane protein
LSAIHLSNALQHKAMIAVLDQIIVSATSFLITIVVGRNCGKEELGLYTLGLSIVLFAVTIQNSLILIPYSVYAPRLKDNEIKVYSGSSLFHQIGLSLIVVSSLLIYLTLFSFNAGIRELKPVVQVLSVTIAFILFREYIRQLTFAYLQTFGALFFDLSVATLQLAGLFVLVFYKILSARWMFLISGLSCSMVVISWFFLKHNDFILIPSKAIAHLKHNWSFGKWQFASSLAYSMSMQLYPWILAVLYGSAATGSFAACMGTIYLANPFILGMSNYLGPRASHSFAIGGIKDLRQTVARGTLFFAVTISLFCILMLLWGGVIITFLYGKAYSGNGLVVGVLALSQLASALTFPVNQGLLAMGRSDVGFKSYILALIVMLIGGFWLVKYFGPVGAAWGLLTANVTASTFRFIAYRKQVQALSI